MIQVLQVSEMEYSAVLIRVSGYGAGGISHPMCEILFEKCPCLRRRNASISVIVLSYLGGAVRSNVR